RLAADERQRGGDRAPRHIAARRSRHARLRRRQRDHGRHAPDRSRSAAQRRHRADQRRRGSGRARRRGDLAREVARHHRLDDSHRQRGRRVDPDVERSLTRLARTPRNAFNLGTSQIAAGQREQGSATLSAAMKDPSLRSDALFNRGNSALASKAFDQAIADYIETLKLRPNHAAAKRNLEIALARKSASQTSTTGNQQNKAGKNQQQQKPTPSANGQKPQGQLDLEALLRSVQQQEQEELRRMKAKANAEGRVGW